MEDSQTIPNVSENGSRHRPSVTWNTRSWGKKPGSVVQSIFARQVGLPLFSRCTDTSSNHSSESIICQQLVQSRGPEESLGKNKAVRPSKVIIKLNGTDLELHKPNESSPWVHLVLPNKTEFHLVDWKVWIVQKESKDVISEHFYVINPATFQIKFIGQGRLKGKMAKFEVLGGRSLDEGNLSTYLLTLMEPGHLRMYDLVKGNVVDEVSLKLNGLTKYADFNVYFPCKKIFVLGVHNGLVKNIYQLLYPPWNTIRVYNVEVPLQNMRFNDGFCIMEHKNNNYLTTWPLLTTEMSLGKACEFETPSPSMRITDKRKLESCPYAIKFRTEKSGCDVLDVSWPPLYYGDVKSNLHILTLKNQAKLVYKCPSPDSNVELVPFPDSSARALILPNDHQTKHEVLTFTTHDIPNESILSDESELEPAQLQIVQVNKISDPFTYWDDRRKQPVPSENGVSQSENKRPRRSCVNVQQFSSKMCILAMSYSAETDLLAVLAADDEEFQVVLYKASINLELFKAFPPVLAWPTSANGSNDKKDFLRNSDVVLEPEFLMVFFDYDGKINPNHEVYFVRTVAENKG